MSESARLVRMNPARIPELVSILANRPADRRSDHQIYEDMKRAELKEIEAFYGAEG